MSGGKHAGEPTPYTMEKVTGRAQGCQRRVASTNAHVVLPPTQPQQLALSHLRTLKLPRRKFAKESAVRETLPLCRVPLPSNLLKWATKAQFRNFYDVALNK